MSVRTLRFYDRIGLLSPSGRTESGYRLYADADLVRLQQILALKFLGFSLVEIQSLLGASSTGLRETLAQQRALLGERRAQLDAIIAATERAESVLETNGHDWDALVSVIRAIQMNQHSDWVKKYFTDEQRQTMEELSQQSYSASARGKLSSRPTWTEEDQRRVDEQYQALYAGVRRAVAAGQDPSGAEGQALAGQAMALIEAFTGGDAEIGEGLQQWWAKHNALPAEQRPVQVPLSEAEAAFLEQAKAIYCQRRKDAGGGEVPGQG